MLPLNDASPRLPSLLDPHILLGLTRAFLLFAFVQVLTLPHNSMYMTTPADQMSAFWPHTSLAISGEA